MSEREKSRGIGPGAVTLTLVILVVVLGILAVLTAVSARNDDRLTTRSIQMTQVYYRLSANAEEHYAWLDQLVSDARRDGCDITQESLMPGMILAGNRITWMEESREDKTEGGMLLSCAVELQPADSPQRLKWVERVYRSDNDLETGEEEWN